MATASTKKQLKEKEKVESRRRMDEIKSLALRQGYVTEDQIVDEAQLPDLHPNAFD